ncbi:hypothetical protein AB1K18_15065 [Peribacillus simplex]|jgi:hypothetical protein
MDNQKSLGDSQAIFLSLYFIGKKQIIANFKPGIQGGKFVIVL